MITRVHRGQKHSKGQESPVLAGHNPGEPQPLPKQPNQPGVSVTVPRQDGLKYRDRAQHPVHLFAAQKSQVLTGGQWVRKGRYEPIPVFSVRIYNYRHRMPITLRAKPALLCVTVQHLVTTGTQ